MGMGKELFCVGMELGSEISGSCTAAKGGDMEQRYLVVMGFSLQNGRATPPCHDDKA